jgi:hypothetical protein
VFLIFTRDIAPERVLMSLGLKHMLIARGQSCVDQQRRSDLIFRLFDSRHEHNPASAKSLFRADHGIHVRLHLDSIEWCVGEYVSPEDGQD